jgi:hypothetical protein
MEVQVAVREKVQVHHPEQARQVKETMAAMVLQVAALILQVVEEVRVL